MIVLSSVEGFSVSQGGRPSTSLNIFGNLGKAFANDDSLGNVENAGIKGVSGRQLLSLPSIL